MEGGAVMVAVKKIEGLAEAEAAASEALNRYLDAREQRTKAEKALQDAIGRREALKDAAKSGQVVSTAQVAEVEVAIRTGEATVALIGEALPALENSVEDAERVVMACACQPIRAEIEAAAKRLAEAEEAHQKATLEKSEAWRANDALCRWDVNQNGIYELEKYAPASLERRTRLDAVKKADRLAAEKKRLAQEREDRNAALQAEVEAEREYYRSKRWPMPAHLAEAR
jgi:hypothetical protein